MRTPAHLAIGALVAAAPDVALALYDWRRDWLPETHPLVRTHRWLHSPASLPWVVGAAWASHLLADRYSTHRTEQTRRGRIT